MWDLVWCSVCQSGCMLAMSNALLMSSATTIVRSAGLFWLKHVAMVVFILCCVVVAFEAVLCGDIVCDVW